jgi:hypothetical protein
LAFAAAATKLAEIIGPKPLCPTRVVRSGKVFSGDPVAGGSFHWQTASEGRMDTASSVTKMSEGFMSE